MGAVSTQLSLKKRRRIEDCWHAKVPVYEMARVLKRHKSTIFREIKRNFCADEVFPKLLRSCCSVADKQMPFCATKADPTSRAVQDRDRADQTRLTNPDGSLRRRDDETEIAETVVTSLEPSFCCHRAARNPLCVSALPESWTSSCACA